MSEVKKIFIIFHWIIVQCLREMFRDICNNKFRSRINITISRKKYQIKGLSSWDLDEKQSNIETDENINLFCWKISVLFLSI